MRALAIILAFLYAGDTYAENKLVVEAKVVHHHASQKTKLFKSGDQWFCETELRPRLKLRSHPSSLALFPQGQRAPSSEACRDKAYLARVQGGKESLWNGCADDASARRFLNALAKDCLR